MTLYEMSFVYREDALRFRMRITELREAEKTAAPEEGAVLRRRIRDLQGLLRQCRELADLTAHYYERGYHRNDKYSI